MRSWIGVAGLLGLVAVVGGGVACVHQPPPLPAEPPDVQGTVWTIQGSFEGGGTLVVRRALVPGQPVALSDRVELRSGARILLRRQGKLRTVNFSAIQLGQHVVAWWDGEPGNDGTARVGPVRVLVIEPAAGPGA